MSRLVLIDRDGTLIADRRYLSSPEQVELFPEAADAIKLLKSLGLRIAVVTNQSAIGRGYFDRARLEQIHERLRMILSAAGADIDALYFCPHLPEDGCECRKPASGMARRAARHFNADLSASFVIGDKPCDIELGKNVGATTILVRTGDGARTEREESIKSDYAVENLLEAASLIKEILEKMTPTQPASAPDLMRTTAREHLLRSAAVKQAVAENCAAEITEAALILIECLRDDGKILLCGNGGSAADCQHLAAEFTSVLSRDFVRPGLAAIALTTDTSFITANANDFGFEGIFERQVQALGRAGDVVIGISTSGNSENVLRALKFAREHRIKTIALTGAGGGALAGISDAAIKVPSAETQLIQESHLSIGHILCALVEIGLFNRPPNRG